jgi:hypothetical protein
MDRDSVLMKMDGEEIWLGLEPLNPPAGSDLPNYRIDASELYDYDDIDREKLFELLKSYMENEKPWGNVVLVPPLPRKKLSGKSNLPVLDPLLILDVNGSTVCLRTYHSPTEKQGILVNGDDLLYWDEQSRERICEEIKTLAQRENKKIGFFWEHKGTYDLEKFSVDLACLPKGISHSDFKICGLEAMIRFEDRWASVRILEKGEAGHFLLFSGTSLRRWQDEDMERILQILSDECRKRQIVCFVEWEAVVSELDAPHPPRNTLAGASKFPLLTQNFMVLPLGKEMICLAGDLKLRAARLKNEFVVSGNDLRRWDTESRKAILDKLSELDRDTLYRVKWEPEYLIGRNEVALPPLRRLPHDVF